MSAKKPVWSEGLFVTEHHLQQQDRYHEELVGDRLSVIQRPVWGVQELQIDLEELARGQFAIVKLRAVFPDGTPVELGQGADPLPASRDVNCRFGPALHSLAVYVAVAPENPVRGNVPLEGPGT